MTTALSVGESAPLASPTSTGFTGLAVHIMGTTPIGIRQKLLRSIGRSPLVLNNRGRLSVYQPPLQHG